MAQAVSNINSAILISMKSDNILYFLPMLYYFMNSLLSVGLIKLTVK
jgi:hypothetical protein